MKHIQTLNTRNLCESAKNGGCGECQTSCQSACKTSCGIANQQCENKADKASKSALRMNAAERGIFYWKYPGPMGPYYRQKGKNL